MDNENGGANNGVEKTRRRRLVKVGELKEQGKTPASNSNIELGKDLPMKQEQQLRKV